MGILRLRRCGEPPTLSIFNLALPVQSVPLAGIFTPTNENHVRRDRYYGGTIGAATAYYLSKQQIGKVALFDKGTIGGGAASWAASLLTQVRAKTDTIPLVQESYRAIEALEAEFRRQTGR